MVIYTFESDPWDGKLDQGNIQSNASIAKCLRNWSLWGRWNVTYCKGIKLRCSRCAAQVSGFGT